MKRSTDPIGQCLGALLLFCLALPASPCRAETVEVVTLIDYPPVSFATRPVESLAGLTEEIPPGSASVLVQGVGWEVFQAAMQRQGYGIRLHFVPWSRGLMLARRGRIDLLVAVQRTPQREQFLAFSKTPVNRVRYAFYLRRGEEAPGPTLASYRGRRIGVMRGWNYGPRLAVLEVEKVPVDSIAQGLELLVSGRIDALAGYAKHFDFVLERSGLAREVRRSIIFGMAPEFVAAPRQRPGARQLLEAFDHGYQALREEGALDAIKSRWAPAPTPPDPAGTPRP